MTNILQAGQHLNVNDRLVSANGRFTLWMQPDGNLVLYHDTIDISAAYWASATDSLPEAQRPVRLEMQSDAHLVLYDADAFPRWASGTWGSGFVLPRAILQDDGNFVIYHREDKPVWASGTVGGAGAIPGRGNVNPGGPNPTLAQTEHTNLGANHFMDTTARLNRSGHVDATTRTRTGTALGGFTGGVSLLLVDEEEIVIASSGSRTFGVDGSIIGTSDRTDYWATDFPAEVAERTSKLVVLHYWAPKWGAINTIVAKAAQIGQTLAPVLAALKAAGLV